MGSDSLASSPERHLVLAVPAPAGAAAIERAMTAAPSGTARGSGDAAATIERLCAALARDADEGCFAEQVTLESHLDELRRAIEVLDPATVQSRKVFGLIAVGDKTADYFGAYERTQRNIDRSLKALDDAERELRKDNAALEQQKVHLWDTVRHIAPPDAQLASAVQVYLALDLVKRCNDELIRGIDTTTTTVVRALREAITVADGLANQTLVLDGIAAMNRGASDVFESTTPGGARRTLVPAPTSVHMDSLHAALSAVVQHVDAIQSFRAEARAVIRSTVANLEPAAPP